MAKSGKKILLIVDGHAVLHRAWHALPPLTTKDGLVVTGAYGFTSILLNALKQFSPTHVAVTFDLKGPTFRHEEYKEYKATREKKPDELYAQVPLIERVLEVMGISVFTAQGFEADDVIGSIADAAALQDDEVESVIVTGDMDTLQLVTKRTKVFGMRRGITDTVLYDEKAVKERYGLKPLQLIDYKALRGDPSDNIPGVRGIGEKTASELIGEFGSIEELYAALDKESKKAAALKPAVREKLLAGRQDAIQAKRLCTIRRDLDVGFSLAKTKYVQATRVQVEPLFTEFQFARLARQFPETLEETEVSPAPAVASVAVAEVAVSGVTHILAKIRKSKQVAFHAVTVTERSVPPEIYGVLVADAEQSWLFSAKTVIATKQAFQELFDEKKIEFVCHDAKRQMNICAALGLTFPAATAFDVMIASYLLYAGERRHSFDAIVGRYRNVPPEPAKATIEERAARIAATLPQLIGIADELGKELKDNALVQTSVDIDQPLAVVLSHMERTGIAIDAPYFKKLSAEMTKSIADLVASIYVHAGGEFNVNSPAQISEVLFDRLGISPIGMKKTAKGGAISTAAAELEKLRELHPVIADILAYRELAKLKSTYVDTIPLLADSKTGRIHTSFNQTVAATGRLASSDPNMQNIPTPETEYGKRVRNGFVAKKGSLLIALDYSQIELRIAAHIAKEKAMIRAFKDGEDIHWRTAVEMFGEDEAKEKRRIAKAINFGILYGMGPQRLSETANISFMEAREYIDRYFTIYSGITQYIEDTKEQLHKQGFVETLFGRKRFFRNFALLGKREQAEAERQAINMPIQGTQADIIKIAMVRIHEALERKFHPKNGAKSAELILQVHDELVFEAEKSIIDEVVAEVRPLMENVIKLSVPVVVTVATGVRWGEMEKKA